MSASYTTRRTALRLFAGAPALAVFPALAAPQPFDAAAYYKMWRDAATKLR